MIYVLREKCPPHQILIGTEREIPMVLDGPDDHAKTFLTIKGDPFGLFDGIPRGPARPGLKSRERGDYGGVFDIRQMEGDEADSLALRLRFTPEGMYEPGDEPYVFYDTAELLAFIDAHTESWTGENALALGQPRRSAEDREAPVSQGLAGRIRRRSG